MSEGYQIVICDAGPIIHLDELDQLSLLNDFGAVYIPKQVWDEVRLHRPQALSKAGPRFHKIDVPLVYESTFQSISKSFSLDLGEQAALMLMQEYPEAIFLTDDAAARLAAVTLGYRVHGSIGILLRAIRRKQLSEVEGIRFCESCQTGHPFTFGRGFCKKSSQNWKRTGSMVVKQK